MARFNIQIRRETAGETDAGPRAFSQAQTSAGKSRSLLGVCWNSAPLALVSQGKRPRRAATLSPLEALRGEGFVRPYGGYEAQGCFCLFGLKACVCCQQREAKPQPLSDRRRSHEWMSDFRVHLTSMLTTSLARASGVTVSFSNFPALRTPATVVFDGA